MTWPPDYTAEYLRRFKFLNVLNEDEELRSGVMAHYKNNCLAWINDFCMTFDPRNVSPIPRLLPFVLFPRQVDFILFLQSCLADKQHGLIEKSRDMGASWLACAFSVWLWLYVPGSVIGWGSRKEEYVDKKGDPKAIFPKIRQIIESLPRWMLPRGFNMDRHAPYMRCINPENGSTITGEAGDNIGRGGRTSIFFKDESAHYERPELVEAALGDNTDVQIDMSSVNGSANVFYRRRMAGEIWTPGCTIAPGKTRVFILDWREHPGKTQAWYDTRRQRAEAEGLLHVLAQEVDRDYSSSIDRLIIRPEWVRAAINAHRILGFTETGECTAGQDVADDGGDKNALAIRQGVILKFIDHWGGEAGEAAKRSVPLCVMQGVHELYYDSIGVGAGFKTETNRMKENNAIPESMRVMPWSASEKPLDPSRHIIPGDMQSPTNEDFFKNLKAQAWWRLRTRFYKTYRAVVHKETYPFEDLISIPAEMERLYELEMELSQAVHTYDNAGKLLVDKKPEGARSPNLADAVVICYCPTRKTSIFDVL